MTTRAYVFDTAGKLENELTLPGPGTAGGFGGKRDDTFVFYTFNSLNVPPAIYRYDIATRKSTVFRAAEGAKLRPGRLRDEAGLLHQQGRHARADVPRLQARA